MLITQPETIDDEPVESLRRAPISTFVQKLLTMLNLDGKADKDNPVITGSLSLGRKAGTAIGANSSAVGNDCEASGPNAHAEGDRTVASGKYAASHAEGERTTASGPRGAHAEGCRTTASGESSHAEGRTTEADSQYTHAEGFFSGAYGKISHAEGAFCRAYGRYSHAEGDSNDAKGDSQHVQGRYCIPDEDGIYAHIVGNGHIADEDQGETEDVHSNAHTLDWDGNAWYAGNVKVGGTSYDDGDRLLTGADLPTEKTGTFTKDAQFDGTCIIRAKQVGPVVYFYGGGACSGGLGDYTSLGQLSGVPLPTGNEILPFVTYLPGSGANAGLLKIDKYGAVTIDAAQAADNRFFVRGYYIV